MFYKKKYKKALATIEALELDRYKLGEMLNEVNDQVITSNREIETLNAQLVKKQVDLDSAVEKARSFRKTLSEKEIIIMDLKKKLEAAEKDRAALEAKIIKVEKLHSTSSKKAQEFKEALALKTAEIKELHTKLKEAKSDAAPIEIPIKGKCTGCMYEGDYRKCTSCLRGHAKDKFTLDESKTSPSADDTNSSDEETIIQEGAIVGESVKNDEIPADADVAELKEANVTLDPVSDDKIPAGADVAELREAEETVDIPPVNKTPLTSVEDFPSSAEEKSDSDKKPKMSRKKKKAAKKNGK